ncbi:MAG: hypothetical protein AVO34_10895 [Firmicutes bacterium ML8_F2]|nr:MAG: hypothetical protein AVO34_10895 [Firmicutes bacterium ML8_F2]
MEKKTHTFKDGAFYEGEWRNGRRHGQGTWSRPDGCRFTGEWADDKPNGLGILILPGGKKYIGEWKNGRRHGLGIEIQADGTKLTGRWSEGQLVSKTSQPEEKKPAEDTEKDKVPLPPEPALEETVKPEKESSTTESTESPTAAEKLEPADVDEQLAKEEVFEENRIYLSPDSAEDKEPKKYEDGKPESYEEDELENYYDETLEEDERKPFWKKWWLWAIIILLAVLAALLFFLSSLNDNGSADPDPDQTEEQGNTVDPDQEPTAEEQTEGDNEEKGPPTIEAGTYVVNEDIEPGLYRSEGGITYFERLSGLSGERKDVIANGAVPNGPVVVEVKESDVAFRSEGSGTWYRLDDSYQPELKSTIEDGCWIVGVDIEAGTYRTDDEIDYWARLSNFSHEVDAVIANDAMVTGGTAVEIKSSDAGFISQGRAIWTKVD